MAGKLKIEHILERMISKEENEEVSVLNVTPYIESDEQHYKVKYTNKWLECGYEVSSFSISEILCFSLEFSFHVAKDKCER